MENCEKKIGSFLTVSLSFSSIECKSDHQWWCIQGEARLRERGENGHSIGF